MAAIKTLQVGRLTLREDFVVSEALDTDGSRTLALTGQESIPRLTAADVQQRREDILGIERAFVPVVFTTKSYLNAFYQVSDVSAEVEDWGDSLVILRWTINLARIGTTAEIDIESRLSGALTRSNSFAATGNRTHAPAIGHDAYWSGASAPTTIDRPCADGSTIRVYRSIGATINPRWAIQPTAYPAGRCRVLDAIGRERAGIRLTLDPALTWEISNGVTRIKPGTGGGTFDVAAWNGAAWESTSWTAQVNNPWVPLTSFDHISLLRNEYEVVSVRFTKSFSPSGRLFVDLTLRRGSRVVELYFNSQFGTRIQVLKVAADAATQTSGYMATSADDANGNRLFIGSTQTFTPNLVNVGISKDAISTLDIALGTIFNGAAAIAGDQAADLYAQYLGMPAELVQGVKR